MYTGWDARGGVDVGRRGSEDEMSGAGATWRRQRPTYSFFDPSDVVESTVFWTLAAVGSKRMPPAPLLRWGQRDDEWSVLLQRKQAAEHSFE